MQINEEIPAVAIARVCHEANRAWCALLGDTSQEPWAVAPAWQRDSAIKGVEGALAGNTPQQSHESWLAEKEATGWRFGEVKDPEAKTHPCMVPYEQLDQAQRAKDALFVGVVRALAPAFDILAPAPVDREYEPVLVSKQLLAELADSWSGAVQVHVERRDSGPEMWFRSLERHEFSDEELVAGESHIVRGQE